MNKKVISILTAIVVALMVLYLYNGYPLVLNKNQKEVIQLSDTTQEKFNPLGTIDFTSGDNIIYLFFNKSDVKELPNGMSKRKLFECSNNKILQDLKTNFLFAKSNGDMATCESEIFIYKESRLIFHSAFVLTDNTIGVQNSLVGWADVTDREKVKQILLKFKPVNRPIVKL